MTRLYARWLLGTLAALTVAWAALTIGGQDRPAPWRSGGVDGPVVPNPTIHGTVIEHGDRLMWVQLSDDSGNITVPAVAECGVGQLWPACTYRVEHAAKGRKLPDRTSITSMARYYHCNIVATPGPDWFHGKMVRGWIVGVEGKGYFHAHPSFWGWEPRGPDFIKAVCQF